MLLFVVTNFLFYQQIVATEYFEHHGGNLLTDESSNWNDWVLNSSVQTLQGPVTDDRLAEFETFTNNSIVFNWLSSLSFSVQSPYKITFFFKSSNNSNISHNVKKRSNTWIDYTILPSNNGICLFENNVNIATFSDFFLSQVHITATNFPNFKFHNYTVRTANHISKKPTILNVSPEIPNIVLYAYLCAHCTLEVYLSDGRKHSLSASESDVTELWKPAYLFVNSSSNIKLVRNTTNGRYDGYWSVDLRSSYKIPSTNGSKNKKDTFVRRSTCNCGFIGSSKTVCQVDCQTAPKIQFSHVDIMNFSVMVYWNIPNNCRIRHFVIDFQNNTYITTRFSYLLENSNFFTSFEIAVAAAIDDNNVGEKTYKTVEIKMGVPKSSELVVINLDGSYRNLIFKTETSKRGDGDPSELMVICQPNITSKPQLHGENETTFASVDFLATVENLHCTSFTRNSAGNSSEYSLNFFTKEMGTYNFSFKPSSEVQNQTDFYNISIKIYPLKNCYNETFSEIATVAHVLVSNTSLNFFTICYSGERSGFSNHAGCIRTNQTFTTIFLQPLRKYSVSVNFVAEYFTSPSVYLPRFKSKPGVPVLSANFTSPTVFGTKAYFTFSKNAFSDVNGEIVAYALILSNQSVEFPRGYGFWNGTNETWPSLPENSIQLTPNFWNPFKDENQNHSFVIGSGENCARQIDCNPPLEPNKKYYFFVRVFTFAAHKSSPLLEFKTRSEIVENKINFLVYIAVPIFLLIFIIIICLYSKNRKTNYFVNNEAQFLLHKIGQSKAIKITQFNQMSSKNFLKKLEQEFDSFEVETTKSSTVALEATNATKNRSTDLYLPYDFNRIVLKTEDGDGKYIDASYIDGFDCTKAYIVAQGPKLNSINKFWRLTWQENIAVIIMTSNTLDNTEIMCREYWPQEKNTTLECDKITITLASQSYYKSYIKRELEVSYNNSKRVIIQLQIKWTSAPERLFPNNLLPAIKFLRKNSRICRPVLIHSGDGVGETGTIILCDLALQMIDCKRKADFYNLTQILREQRHLIVTDLAQYALAHFTVKECIMDKENPFRKPVSKNTVKEQLEYLNKLCYHDSLLQTLTPKRKTQEKNSGLIDSVLRYGGGGGFLVPRDPLVEESGTLWSMVAKEFVEHIIFLDKKIPFQNVSFNEGNEVIKLTHLEVKQIKCYTVRKFSLVICDLLSKKIHQKRIVSVFEFNDWEMNSSVPNSAEKFVEMVNAINELETSKRTLIWCNNGHTASGLFVVLSYILEQYKLEKRTDVCTAIRVSRREGKQFITEDQLTFLYECISIINPVIL